MRTTHLKSIKHETRRQIFINFYRNFSEKRIPYTVVLFALMKIGRWLREDYVSQIAYTTFSSGQARQGEVFSGRL